MNRQFEAKEAQKANNKKILNITSKLIYQNWSKNDTPFYTHQIGKNWKGWYQFGKDLEK